MPHLDRSLQTREGALKTMRRRRTASLLAAALTLTASAITATTASADPVREVYSAPNVYAFTVPDGVTLIKVFAISGGGGGGGGGGKGAFGTQGGAGGGGGGGATVRCDLAVEPGDTLNITINPLGTEGYGGDLGLLGIPYGGGNGGYGSTVRLRHNATTGQPIVAVDEGNGGGGGYAALAGTASGGPSGESGQASASRCDGAASAKFDGTSVGRFYGGRPYQTTEGCPDRTGHGGDGGAGGAEFQGQPVVQGRPGDPGGPACVILDWSGTDDPFPPVSP